MKKFIQALTCLVIATILASSGILTMAPHQAQAKVMKEAGEYRVCAGGYTGSVPGAWPYKRTLTKKKLTLKLKKNAYYHGVAYPVPKANRAVTYKLSKKVKFYKTRVLDTDPYKEKRKRISIKTAKKLLKKFDCWAMYITIKNEKVTKIEFNWQ